jgi:hypothetical protein
MVKVPELGVPDVNDGFKDGLVPESFKLASPLTGVFSMVVVASATAVGAFPTKIDIVVELHTIGLTLVLQIV